MGAGASTPRKAQPDGDEDDETAVRAILAELGGCGVPQMGIAAESLRLAVASETRGGRAQLGRKGASLDAGILVSAPSFLGRSVCLVTGRLWLLVTL